MTIHKVECFCSTLLIPLAQMPYFIHNIGNMKKSFVYACVLMTVLLMGGLVAVQRTQRGTSFLVNSHSSMRPVATATSQKIPLNLTDILEETPSAARHVALPPRQLPPASLASQAKMKGAGLQMPSSAIPQVSGMGLPTRRYTFASAAPRQHLTPIAGANRSTPKGRGYSYTKTAPVIQSAHGTAAQIPTEHSSQQTAPTTQSAASEMEGYLSKLTQDERKALDMKVQHMSNAIEQAFVRAMAPKNKQEQAIAKYLQRRGTQGKLAPTDRTVGGFLASSPEGQVMQQLVTQTQSIVNAVRDTYGDQAAAGASRIMKQFQREMADLLNSNLSAEQKQLRAQALNKKYNDKLQKYNEKEAKNKIEGQLRGEHEKLLTQVRTQFDSETESAIRAKLEENIPKRIEIMQTPQSEESMYRQLLALETQQQKDIKEILLKNNPNDPNVLNKWTHLLNQQAKEQAQAEAAAVERGEKEGQLFRVKEETLQEYKEKWEKQDDPEILKGLSSYGPQVQEQASGILRRFHEQQLQLLAEGGETSQLNADNAKLVEDVNKQLRQLREQNKEIFVQNTTEQFNRQNDERLQQYTNYLSDLSDSQKEQWRTQAQRVMQSYNAKRAALLAERDTHPNVSAQWAELDKQEREALAQIPIADDSQP